MLAFQVTYHLNAGWMNVASNSSRLGNVSGPGTMAYLEAVSCIDEE